MSRILIDIEHLDLDRVPLLTTGARAIVALGKHLCGVATDLSLSCLANSHYAAGDGRCSSSEPPAQQRDRGEVIFKTHT